MSGPLHSGYSPTVRRFELASIAAFALTMAYLFARMAHPAWAHPLWAIAAIVVGFVVADFSSGLVHWAADTWGTPEWPFVGTALIRPFREHHVDQKGITRHDFVETNGNNCFISLVPVVTATFFPPELFFLQVMVFAGCLAIFGTNQFHKWSHMDTPPRLAALLQRVNLILPPRHHAIHHRAPFSTYYCITVGWLNAPLDRIGFFRRLERLIIAATGLVPREHELRGPATTDRV